MKSTRPFRHEQLESRRLLAAELDLNDFGPMSRIPWESADLQQVEAIIGDSDLLEGVKNLDFVAPFLYPGLSYGPDLVQEVGDRLFVVDQSPRHDFGGSLLVFQRAAEGELDLVHEFKFKMHVDQMIVHDERVVLIGNRFDMRIMAPAGPVAPLAKLFRRCSTPPRWIGIGCRLRRRYARSP